MQQPEYKPPIPSAYEQAPYSSGPLVNTSGQGASAVVPPEVASMGFNWGAFLMNWIWGIGHSVWIALVALVAGFVPVIGGFVSLGFCIYLGINGNAMAWRNRRFESLEQFREVQKAWTKWGIILTVAGIVIGVLAAIALVTMGGRVPQQIPQQTFQPLAPRS